MASEERNRLDGEEGRTIDYPRLIAELIVPIAELVGIGGGSYDSSANDQPGFAS
jgi:hypothetical protein